MSVKGNENNERETQKNKDRKEQGGTEPIVGAK